VKRLAVTLSGLALVVSLAACGGDSEAGGAKGQFIAQGDVICSEGIERVDAINPGTDTATLEKVRDAWRQMWDQIDALPVPKDGEAKALEFKSGVHNMSLTAEAAVQASMIGGQQKVDNTLQILAASTKKAGEVADDYGFKVCSQLK
jgi:hypothetical protein